MSIDSFVPGAASSVTTRERLVGRLQRPARPARRSRPATTVRTRRSRPRPVRRFRGRQGDVIHYVWQCPSDSACRSMARRHFDVGGFTSTDSSVDGFPWRWRYVDHSMSTDSASDRLHVSIDSIGQSIARRPLFHRASRHDDDPHERDAEIQRHTRTRFFHRRQGAEFRLAIGAAGAVSSSAAGGRPRCGGASRSAAVAFAAPSRPFATASCTARARQRGAARPFPRWTAWIAASSALGSGAT